MATAHATYIQPPYSKEHLPESDGKPIAETDKHRKQMISLLDAAEEYFRADPNVYVTGNIFVHFRSETGEWKSVAPDFFVVRGVKPKDRLSYNLEDEGKAPDMVIELVSASSKVEDLGNKRVIYAGLGVREYFLFDPTGKLLKGQLRGFRLEDGDYMPMMGARLHSEVLGLHLVVEQSKLRLYDPKTGQRLLNHEEAEAARRDAEAKAAQELAARQAAEAEIARLREELAKFQGRQP